jgi:phosphoribosylanthranilate isomerase
MGKIKLKICGLRSPENIRETLRFKPDFIGFIFYPRSPRYVGDQIRWIKNLETGNNIQKVGVFVNAPVEIIMEMAAEAGIEYLQLHGGESPDYCRMLKEKGFHMIKVFSVKEGLPFREMKAYVRTVDYFLFDTGGKYLGGNGIAFDWSLLEKYPYEVPFFLSGGIGSDNIGHVRYLHHPMLYAVDVNSKLESKPGFKDTGLLEKFMGEFEKMNHD